MCTQLRAIMKNNIVAGIMHLFLAFNRHRFNGMDADIELVPDEQYQRIDINYNH